MVNYGLTINDLAPGNITGFKVVPVDSPYINKSTRY